MDLSRGRPRSAAHPRFQLLRWVLLHGLLAALTATLIVAVGLLGMFVAMAPRFISEAVEPLSLLLLPGLFFAIASVGPHDFKPETVVKAGAIFWFVAVFAFFSYRARAQRR